MRHTYITVISMIFVGMLFYFYEYFLRVLPSIIKPQLQWNFGLSETDFGYLVAFYYYAYMPMQVPVGILTDKYGAKKILTFACALCTIGIFIFVYTSQLHVAQFAQWVLGFGSAFAYVGILKISNDWLAPKYFSFITGLCATVGMMGAIGGQVITELSLVIMGWQSTFVYVVSFGSMLTFVLWFTLRDNKSGTSVLQENISSVFVLTSFLMGIITVMKKPQMWVVGVIGCLSYLPISVFAGIWAPDFFIAKGLDKTNAVLGSSLLFLGFAIGCPFWGYVSEWIKIRRMLLMLGSFLAALCLMAALWINHTEYFLIFALLFLVGFFSGVEIIIYAIGNSLVQSSVCATAASFINMIAMIGAVILPPIIGKLLDQQPFENYVWVFTILPFGLFLAALLSMFLKESDAECTILTQSSYDSSFNPQ